MQYGWQGTGGALPCARSANSHAMLPPRSGPALDPSPMSNNGGSVIVWFGGSSNAGYFFRTRLIVL